jgi:SAM-dependent methyltransferase
MGYLKTYRMKPLLERLLFYFKKIYRISISYKKYEEIVWNDLKKLHKNSEWRYGVFENDKHIETVFEIGEKTGATFYYIVYDGQYHCRVKVIEDFSPDVTTDIFVLAAHFNNLLNIGVVVVNVQSRYVEYHIKNDFIVNIVYPGELHTQLLRHFNISKDIYWAFNKLVNENEEPTLIIADLMRMNKKDDKDRDDTSK